MRGRAKAGWIVTLPRMASVGMVSRRLARIVFYWVHVWRVRQRLHVSRHLLFAGAGPLRGREKAAATLPFVVVINNVAQ